MLSLIAALCLVYLTYPILRNLGLIDKMNTDTRFCFMALSVAGIARGEILPKCLAMYFLTIVCIVEIRERKIKRKQRNEYLLKLSEEYSIDIREMSNIVKGYCTEKKNELMEYGEDFELAEDDTSDLKEYIDNYLNKQNE